MDSLLSKLSTSIVHIVASVLPEYDTILNFSKGKAESIVCLRGKDTKATKARLAEVLDPDGATALCIPNVTGVGDVRLRVVDSYKHLL